jgi:hypothetical protein
MALTLAATEADTLAVEPTSQYRRPVMYIGGGLVVLVLIIVLIVVLIRR